VPLDFSGINNSVNYFDLFEKPDLMIHLAWEGLPNYKALFHTEVNLPRHYVFIENLVRNGLTDITVTGTCFEYGMKEGCLTESMPAEPANAYSLAKDTLRKQLEDLQLKKAFHLKWVRLFYMYGKGQNPNAILAQLERAIDNKEPVFNMSGGEQIRDYLPVESVAKYIVKIALQRNVEGIINCCSGQPVSVKDLVSAYVKASGQFIKLNLGFYPYPDYEPMSFWGDTSKLKSILNNE
jgi:nucleoside-diphosphate-sugar epimerase